MITEFDFEKSQLAEMVKRVRKYANLSQRDLSRITGISQSDISKIERGLGNPSLSTISKIMSATGTKLSLDYTICLNNDEYIVESWGKVDEKIRAISSESAKLVRKSMETDVDSILLYGSCARGENTEESDIDIAILTACDRLSAKKYDNILVDIAASMMSKYLEVVNFVCLPTAEYNEKKDWYPYFKNIEREGVILYAKG